MTGEASDPDGFIKRWFAALCEDAARTNGCPQWFDQGSMGSMLLEVLSDSSNELFCAGFLAAHLRRFGTKDCKENGQPGMFWVRSEWAKFDLCYGIASSKFPKWKKAWSEGTTGDLGAIEIKVTYEHFSPSAIRDRIKELKRQIVRRRSQVAGWQRQRKRGGPAAACRYYGLVLHVSSSGGDTTTVEDRCHRVGLGDVTSWSRLGTMSRQDLEGHWPLDNVSERWDLHAKVVAAED